MSLIPVLQVQLLDPVSVDRLGQPDPEVGGERAGGHAVPGPLQLRGAG